MNDFLASLIETNKTAVFKMLQHTVIILIKNKEEKAHLMLCILYDNESLTNNFRLNESLTNYFVKLMIL